MKKLISVLFSVIMIMTLTACESTSSSEAEKDPQKNETSKETEFSQEKTQQMTKQNAKGAIPPQEALEYMKETKNLVIIDVAATRWYDENHFKGAINIPIEELDSDAQDALYMEIPTNRPVLMHCRRGVIVPNAYQRILELRPDIPEISYIDGTPLFDEYNEWYTAR